MSRFLLSAAALFSLLISLLVVPTSVDARSRRCEEEPPETLLSLYRNSTEIHIGKFDRIEDVSVREETEDYTAVEIKKHFSLRTTLKGEPRKFYAAAEQDYRYKNVESEPAEGEDGEMHADVYTLSPGDDVMIFLKTNEDEETVVLSHYRDAIKKLDSDQMSIYEKSVRELNAIFAAKKVDDAEIVAWLVKTAVDPVTRWEGAFELLTGFQTTEWRDERVKYLKEKEEKGEAIEDWEREDVENEDANTKARTAYTKMLTSQQKDALLDAVIAQDSDSDDSSEEKGRSKLSEGDRMLIDLVSRWGDSRFASHLLSRLQNEPEEPYLNSQLMEKVAKIINDGRVDDLVSRYGNLYYEDTEQVSAEDLAAAMPNANTASSGDGKSNPVITYGELRAKLLGDFISLSQSLLTTAKN